MKARGSVALQTTFRGFTPRPSLEKEVQEEARRLDRFASDLMSCLVTIEAPGGRHRKGEAFQIGVELRVHGEAAFVGEHHADADPALAVRRAFEAAERWLEDRATRLRDAARSPDVTPRAAA
jgi:hypothetical protein